MEQVKSVICAQIFNTKQVNNLMWHNYQVSGWYYYRIAVLYYPVRYRIIIVGSGFVRVLS